MKWLFLAVIVLWSGREIQDGPREVYREEHCAELAETWRLELAPLAAYGEKHGIKAGIKTMDWWCLPWRPGEPVPEFGA